MILATGLAACLLIGAVQPVSAQWRHPAGLVTSETLADVRDKLRTHDWARRTYESRKRALQPWMTADSEHLHRVFPRQRGNVYHNFSCPDDRKRLVFDPFAPERFRCPSCDRTYAPQTDAGIYGAGDRYHGTMYDGWICLFHLEAGDVAAALGIMGRIEGEAAYLRRGVEILMLYADVLEALPTRPDPDPQMRVILTYHREGDNKVLNDLAVAYELLRDTMTAEQRARFEKAVLQRMLDDIMLEPIYRYEHNNLYQWHRTIVQAALALEREDLVDWSFGYGSMDTALQPEHRSIRRLAATHFKPDGAYWEMCSGYHLYPLHFFCEFAVVSRNLARMDPTRFPPERYDITVPGNPVGETVKNALEWFLSMAPPDRIMPTVGDSMAAKAGMADYYAVAEVGYRFYGVRGIGDYPSLQTGDTGSSKTPGMPGGGGRTWAGLLYGAPEIRKHKLPFTSSYLSSGWVSLRSDWNGRRTWAGLNALIPGGGHQHADRLTLLTHAQGQLLALEKSTPYNESTIRELATFSPMHNTVTIDQTSQPQGESLKGPQVPEVALFFGGSFLQFAQVRADRLHAQTQTYRRSVALIEDVIIDRFDVRGGRTHDWMLHHAGPAPRVSLQLAPAVFEPQQWLLHGTSSSAHATPDGPWTAEWQVNGVTSRLWMAGSPGTELYTLETYPIDNAVITPANPPCQTLCVRRANDSPYVAVWDAWRDAPNVRSVSAAGEGLRVETAGTCWYVLFAPGTCTFADGVSLETDAAFALLRGDTGAAFISGTRLEVRRAGRAMRLVADARASVAVEIADGIAEVETAGDIHYETRGGRDHMRPAPDARIGITGDLWSVREQRLREAR